MQLNSLLVLSAALLFGADRRTRHIGHAELTHGDVDREIDVGAHGGHDVIPATRREIEDRDLLNARHDLLVTLETRYRINHAVEALAIDAQRAVRAVGDPGVAEHPRKGHARNE